MIFSVPWFDPQCLFKMAPCIVELSLCHQQRAEIDVRFRRTGIQAYRLGKFLCCFIVSPGVLQFGGVINMGARACWKIRSDRRQTLELTLSAVHLRKPEHPKRNDEDSEPFRAVQSPAGQRTA